MGAHLSLADTIPTISLGDWYSLASTSFENPLNAFRDGLETTEAFGGCCSQFAGKDTPSNPKILAPDRCWELFRIYQSRICFPAV